MESYKSWQQNKLYQKHIDRLKVMNKIDKPMRRINHQKNQSKMFSTSKQQHKRSKTQSITCKNKQRRMLRVPIPLVSTNQAKLIKNTLNSRSMPLKDKQQILQNYLLSRRILKTKSTLKLDSSTTSFNNNLSHRSSTKKIIESTREKKFRIYSKQKQDNKNVIMIAQGSNFIQFKINHIMMIKGVLGKGPQVKYNLDILVGKHQNKQIKALKYDELFKKKLRIRWKRGLCNKKPDLMISIVVLRQNFAQELGIFRLQIADFQTQAKQNIKKVYRIMRGKFPVGTIEIQGTVNLKKTKNKQQTEKYQNYIQESSQNLKKKYKTSYLYKERDSFSRENSCEFQDSTLKAKFDKQTK